VLAFTTIGCLIAAPFNDALSERVEHLVLKHTNLEKFSFVRILRDAKDAFIVEAKKLSLIIFLQAMLLLLHLIPVVGNTAYFILAGTLTLVLLAFEYVDYPMSRKNMTFGTRKSFVTRNFAAMFGFGGAVSLTLMIPLLNFVCMPACVVGATLMYMESTGVPIDGPVHTRNLESSSTNGGQIET
jgi:CysZ protein